MLRTTSIAVILLLAIATKAEASSSSSNIRIGANVNNQRRVSDQCQDDSTWIHLNQHGNERTCYHVGKIADKVLSRCNNWLGVNGKLAREACPSTCGNDPFWVYHSARTNEARTCHWIALQPEDRCDKIGTNNKSANEACPVACCGIAESTPTDAPSTSPTVEPTLAPTTAPTTAPTSCDVTMCKDSCDGSCLDARDRRENLCNNPIGFGPSIVPSCVGVDDVEGCCANDGDTYEADCTVACESACEQPAFCSMIIEQPTTVEFFV